jgi:hypothetical protein
MRSVLLSGSEILDVPTVLARGLDDAVAAQLPASTPPAPWHSNIEMALWSFRATPASAAAVPSPLVPSLPLGACAFIHYLDGAVGPYHEILATPRCVRAPGSRAIHGHVPFIAVDSIPSVHGGRANWALPKLYGAFSGAPATEGVLSGAGEDWRVLARVRQRGPWFPLRVSGSCAQPWPDGSVGAFTSRFRGHARLARLHIEVTGSEALGAVLPSGRHLGMVFRGTVDVGPPR